MLFRNKGNCFEAKGFAAQFFKREVRMQEKCSECKYLSRTEIGCILGRNPLLCESRKARRGDEELIDRLLSVDAESSAKIAEQ